ncbi:MAG: helix-turn-helix domain-containing protein [Lachnospiraceae bacterium]
MLYPTLEKYIIDNNLSINEFGRLCGVTDSTMCRYLSGKICPNKKSIDKILKATGLKYEDAFMEGDRFD